MDNLAYPDIPFLSTNWALLSTEQ